MARPLGLTSITILSALEDRRCYGLDVIDRTGLLAGTVYTTLRRMEKRGLVEGRWEDPAIAEDERRPRRRYYTLLPDGASALAEARSRIRRVLPGMSGDASTGRQKA